MGCWRGDSRRVGAVRGAGTRIGGSRPADSRAGRADQPVGGDASARRSVGVKQAVGAGGGMVRSVAEQFGRLANEGRKLWCEEILMY